MRFPRLLSLTVVVALASGSAACSPGGGTSSSTGGDGKTLTMWTFKQSHVKALQNVAQGFTAKTGITVNVQAITPDDAFVTRVQAAAQTKNLPDLMEVHTNGDDFTFGAAGLLLDLKNDATWTSRYLPSVANEGLVTDAYYKQSQPADSKTHGIKLGQRLSVPLTIGTFGIVYANKQRLAAAGVTRAPTTWEQFIADLAAVQKTSPANGGVSIGFQSATTGLEWLLQPMAYGKLGKADFQALFSTKADKNFASPNGKAVLDTYNQVTPYWMPGTQTLTIDDADIAFAQGKSSFDIGGTFTLAFLAQNGMKADDIVTFPVPAPQGGAVPNLSLAPFALTGVSVSAGTKNKAGAVKWLDYLAQKDVAARFAQDALDVPPVDLGTDPSSTLGPVLGAMIASFGSGDTAYNPGDTTYKPDTYDGSKVAPILMDLSPLKKQDSAATGAAMAKIIDGYWSGK
jgi:ABC-type glycerol-3-phosphate transport system substrate-binding protein